MPKAKRDADAQLAKLRHHQTILVDFGRVSAEATDLQRLMDIACYHASRAVGVEHSKILQFRHDKGDLLVVAGRGWKSGTVGHARLGADMLSPPGRAYQTRDTICIGDLPGDSHFRLSPILRDHGIVSVLNAPIAIDGIVWGVLEVDSGEPDRFDKDDQQFMQSLALILALAIRHRQAQDERERSAEELGRRLAQADTLLDEQNHRVRNYFQMILSILATRSRRAASQQIRLDYEEVMDRITAIALAQDQLTFPGGGRTHVTATTYVDALCLGLERTVDGELNIERDVEAIELRADRAVPVGLIVNELVVNAIKYAAKGRPDPVIKVHLAGLGEGEEACLEISDNGPGMGEARPGSTGLKLVESFVRQLSGRLEIDSTAEGTTVRVIFPLVE